MNYRHTAIALSALVASTIECSAFQIFQAAGANAAAITATRDSFRTAIGGGTVAGASGDFGGLRREINWDGVPDGSSDPNSLPGDFFNATSPRGVVLTTPGTGFLVSANSGAAAPVLFGFSSDLQTFSSQRLFTAVNSNITDVSFFLPGTLTAATTTAFGLVFVDVEAAGGTKVDFFDQFNNLLLSRQALTAGNQGLSFLGVAADSGEKISRVRITSGLNHLVSNGTLGNPNDDFVVMDDFIYATPLAATGASPVPDSSSAHIFLAMSLLGLLAMNRRLSPEKA